MSGEKGAEQGRTDVTEVGTARFELATPRSQSECATGLRYAPNLLQIIIPSLLLSRFLAMTVCASHFALVDFLHH